MSPVDRAIVAWFPRSRLTTISFVKISVCLYEKAGWPVYRDLGFPTKISVTGTGQPSLNTGMKNKIKYACVSVEGERSWGDSGLFQDLFIAKMIS